MSKLIILRGYPGAGKTTIGKELRRIGVGKFIDHNAILTFVAGIVGDDDGIYSEISMLEQAMCRKLLEAGESVVVARGFSRASSIGPYVEIANDLGAEFKVVRLDVSLEKLLVRVQSPERRLDFNPSVESGSTLSWIHSNPIEDIAGEVIIKNEDSLDNVVRLLVGKLST